MSGCGGSDPIDTHLNSVISHVVIIFQENRTPGNLFQDPVLIARGADIASSGVNSHGGIIPLAPIPLATTYDLSHTHPDSEDMYDNGKMDGADRIPKICYRLGCPPNPQFRYVPPSDVQPYFSLAEQYTFGDRMFQTNEGPGYPAHQFILSGTSAPSPGSTLFEAENPFSVGFGPVGCTVPASETVAMIDSADVETVHMYPCFEYETMTDLLDRSRRRDLALLHSDRRIHLDGAKFNPTHVRTHGRKRCTGLRFVRVEPQRGDQQDPGSDRYRQWEPCQR